MWAKSTHFLLLFLVLGRAHSFLPATSAIPRGGASLSSLPIASLGEGISLVTSNLQSGPFGVLALATVTSSVVLPLTLYKKVYGIGVAYGFSVFAAGLALLNVFSANASSAASGVLLAKACMFYGVRLGSYLLLRDAARKQESKIKNGPVSSRITFALSLALFYAFLTTPALYAMRNTPALASSVVATSGAYLAWFGAGLEAVADAQKFLVKQANKDVDGTFVGPTSLTYQISRHPNYLGEVLFWTGLFVGGAPSFGRSIPAWLCSGLGLAGIVSIMLKAASGLEKRQEEKYGGQEKYDNWKKQVSASLIPFIN
jgi:steroid 5-alpha reductase family enzyme